MLKERCSKENKPWAVFNSGEFHINLDHIWLTYFIKRASVYASVSVNFPAMCSLLPLRQLDVRLVEKMKLNCQVFKEEISMVHLNRQVAHLQNALQDRREKVQLIEMGLQTHRMD